MSTFLTTDDTNDLYLDDNNNIAISTSRLIEIKQRVKDVLQTFLGEIPTNLDLGVDYFGIILPKEVPLETKLNELTNNILSVSGVIGVSNIDYSLQDAQADFNITVQTDAGNFNLSDLSLIV